MNRIAGCCCEHCIQKYYDDAKFSLQVKISYEKISEQGLIDS